MIQKFNDLLKLQKSKSSKTCAIASLKVYEQDQKIWINFESKSIIILSCFDFDLNSFFHQLGLEPLFIQDFGIFPHF